MEVEEGLLQHVGGLVVCVKAKTQQTQLRSGGHIFLLIVDEQNLYSLCLESSRSVAFTTHLGWLQILAKLLTKPFKGDQIDFFGRFGGSHSLRDHNLSGRHVSEKR